MHVSVAGSSLTCSEGKREDTATALCTFRVTRGQWEVGVEGTGALLVFFDLLVKEEHLTMCLVSQSALASLMTGLSLRNGIHLVKWNWSDFPI